jgi:hypothetical protein
MAAHPPPLSNQSSYIILLFANKMNSSPSDEVFGYSWLNRIELFINDGKHLPFIARELAASFRYLSFWTQVTPVFVTPLESLVSLPKNLSLLAFDIGAIIT